jgi:hypothetical protein
MFVQYNYQLQHQAAIERNQMDFEQSLEQFEISGTLDTNNFIHVVVNNTGPVTVQIVYLFVNSTVKTIDLTSNPVTVNSGSFASINSTQKYTTGKHYILKVVTARGNIASCQYPPPPSPEAQIALIAKGVGPILVEFESFKWASYSGSLGGLNLSKLTWNSAWSIDKNTRVIWKVRVINHDTKDIYLDNHSILVILGASGSSVGNAQSWYIVNATGGVVSAYKGSGYINDGSISIPANPNDPATGGTPITIYFASATRSATDYCVTPNQVGTYIVFITLKGNWYYGGTYAPYAQSLIPIVAIEVT